MGPCIIQPFHEPHFAACCCIQETMSLHHRSGHPRSRYPDWPSSIPGTLPALLAVLLRSIELSRYRRPPQPSSRRYGICS